MKKFAQGFSWVRGGGGGNPLNSSHHHGRVVLTLTDVCPRVPGEEKQFLGGKIENEPKACENLGKKPTGKLKKFFFALCWAKYPENFFHVSLDQEMNF